MKQQRRHGRWTSNTSRRPAGQAARLTREIRRLETLRSIVANTAAEHLSHELVAQASGLPVGYLQWRYPSIGALAALAEGASGRIIT
jgi:hypothetical protein